MVDEDLGGLRLPKEIEYRRGAEKVRNLWMR